MNMKRTSADAKMNHFFAGVPIRLHCRSDLHLLRKAWHMIMGLVIVYCYMAGTSRSTGVLILGSVLGFDLLMETSRLKIPSLNEKLMKFWAPFLRSHEVNRMSTVPHYVSAAIIAIGIFPKPVAILSLLYLACGDPIASLFGILYGHLGPRFSNGKSLVGTAAGVLVCSVLTFVYLKSLDVSDSAVLWVSIIGGLAGGLTELLPFEVDDNFTIPVISGFVLWFVFLFLGL
jgi:dolichol kinase